MKSVSYRQSKELNELSKSISEEKNVLLPEYNDKNKISPVLLENVKDDITMLSDWLQKRINEIEKCSNKLPSIAIFVNSEEEIDPLTEELNKKLYMNNIQVVSCPDGKVIGKNTDIRVFNIKHIKGLEFEAVFFISIDSLTQRLPSIFDKYLYVGVTRAATYLGITCNKSLPQKIEHSRKMFVEDWKNFN
ncbi:helicase UvrD [Candidatus Magnetomorum sp. HK-1]|nr:helicase UvrD [Candidatus Magnetomorum sp. HK-1]